MQLASKFISSLCSTFITRRNPPPKDASSGVTPFQVQGQPLPSHSLSHNEPTTITNLSELNMRVPISLKRKKLLSKLKSDIDHVQQTWILKTASPKTIKFLYAMLFANRKLQRGNSFESLWNLF